MMLLLASWLCTAWADPAAALESLRAGNKLTARRLAEEALVLDPDDFVAHYVVAEVFWNEEGNLPRALHHFKIADRLYTRKKATLDGEAWRTHWHVLRGKAFVAESMENLDLFLDTVAEYNALYDPDLAAETGWALLKDERLDEARRIAERAVASEDDWQRSLGLNLFCALEAKARDRQACMDACDVNLAHGRATQDDIVVEAYNAATSAVAVFDFGTAEALLIEASSAPAGGPTNAWSPLVGLYLIQGRGAEAVVAAKRMQAWRHAQPPPARAQSRAGADATVAAVLLVAGESERGLEIIERALRHPDRRASTTASHDSTRAMHLMIRGALRRLEAEKADERASMDGVVSRSRHWLASWLPDLEAWDDRTTLGGILSDGVLLARSVAPYEDDGVVPAPWMAGDLIHALGPGVMQASIDRGREIEHFAGLGAYYDALEAEVAWTRGQGRTLELANRALEGLSEAEVLLRGRVAAIAADHAHRWGDPRAAGLYERALQLDPSALRRLGLSLPATVRSSGSELDEAVATMLRRSPRLSRDPGGFAVTVTAGEICLSSPLGARLGCHGGGGTGTVDERARSAVQAFHDGAFALPLGLKLLDMRSLDGTTRLDADSRRDALKGVLGDL